MRNEIEENEMNYKDQEYQGFSNWHTWNVNLWLNNEEISWRHLMDCASGEEIEELWKSLYNEGHDNIELDKVDWNEIYNDKETE